MELSQTSSKGIKRKRKLTPFQIYKYHHHRTKSNKVIPSQSCCWAQNLIYTSHLKEIGRGLTPSNGYWKWSSKSGLSNGTSQTELAPILLELWSNSSQIRVNNTFASHLTSTVLVWDTWTRGFLEREPAGLSDGVIHVPIAQLEQKLWGK